MCGVCGILWGILYIFIERSKNDLYVNIFMPIWLFGSRFGAWKKKKYKNKFNVIRMGYLRNMYNKTKRSWIQKVWIWIFVSWLQTWVTSAKNNILRWFSHPGKGNEDQLAKQINEKRVNGLKSKAKLIYLDLMRFYERRGERFLKKWKLFFLKYIGQCVNAWNMDGLQKYIQEYSEWY